MGARRGVRRPHVRFDPSSLGRGQFPPCQTAKPVHISGLKKEYMATETKNFQSFQIHEKDTGSADVQIALLTQRINQLTEHLKAHVKDHSSRRGLLMMVAKRRSLLDYLKDTASDRYKIVLEKLNLRK